MLDSIPVDQRESASSLIKQAAADLGVPYDRARRILYWHAHRSKQKLLSMEVLKVWLSRLDALIRAYNQEIAMQQLRRQGPPVPQPVQEDLEG
jgi:hypothetical protein